MNLREIRERHKEVNKFSFIAREKVSDGSLAHQDRAYLLKLTDDFKKFLDGYKVLINNNLTPDWLDQVYYDLIEKLEVGVGHEEIT